MSNDYHFITQWRFEGTVADVYELIGDPFGYTRWWPTVYLDVQQLEPGDANGIGRRFRFHTKGWLPYTLRWESRVTEIDRPNRLVIRATGDFDGRGIWTLKQEGGAVAVEFDWKLSAEKPLIRYLSFLFKPLFSANHRWAMAQGEKGLAQELVRRAPRKTA
jgi:uncharacterized protein YndB with AHSA1/START domain